MVGGGGKGGKREAEESMFVEEDKLPEKLRDGGWYEKNARGR